MALASVIAEQHAFSEMAEGSDSARIELFLSNGKRLTSPLMGAPRYRTEPGQGKERREAVWRWAWHSLADTVLVTADSSAVVDSCRTATSWCDKRSGQKYQLTKMERRVPICLMHKKLD